MMREKERRERARELYAKYQEEKMDLSGSDPADVAGEEKNGDGLHELGLVDALGRRG
jgi:hypothetical protein